MPGRRPQYPLPVKTLLAAAGRVERARSANSERGESLQDAPCKTDS